MNLKLCKKLRGYVRIMARNQGLKTETLYQLNRTTGQIRVAPQCQRGIYRLLKNRRRYEHARGNL